ncbi:hypothetical protein [Actinocrispum sp. NPDC049592]|uniref:hypothetical protein n=1 Tax=Actinocrispum sp. NPDC049592 TaxID=3154835 RepID=UPI0034416D7B
MSRARLNSTGWLRVAPAAVGLALALAGCGAGQIAQTSGMEPAVNGGTGQAGTIAIRDVRLAYPQDGVYRSGADAVVEGVIVNTGQADDQLVGVTSPAGEAEITGDRKLPAGTSLVIAPGSGGTTKSSSSSSSSSATVTTTTTPSAPSGSATPPSASGGASGSASGSASSGSASGSAATTTSAPTTTSSTQPVVIGKINIVITGLTQDIVSGKTIEITFVFASGQATVTVPIATPTTPRQAPVEESP